MLGDGVGRHARQQAILASLSNGWRVGSGGIDTNTVWSEEGRGRKHIAEEALGRVEVAIGGQQEVDRIAVLVDGSVQVASLTTDLDAGLINPDRPAMRLAELPTALLDQRFTGKHPAVQGGVAHLDTTLQEELLDVAAAERVAQVLGDGLDDEHCLTVSAFEVALGEPFQRHSDGRQDHPRVTRKVKAVAAAEENAKAHDVYLEGLDSFLRAKHGVSPDELSAD